MNSKKDSSTWMISMDSISAGFEVATARSAADVGVVGEGAESERVVLLEFPRILSSSGDRPVNLLGGMGRSNPSPI